MDSSIANVNFKINSAAKEAFFIYSNEHAGNASALFEVLGRAIKREEPELLAALEKLHDEAKYIAMLRRSRNKR